MNDIAETKTELTRDNEPKKHWRVNRLAYIAEAALEYFISLLITGAFLAAILKNIGVPDSVTGITTSLASFGFSAQLAAVLFIKPKTSVKRMVTVLMLINQLMFVSLYMIPFIKIGHSLKVALFVIMFLGGHFLTNMAVPFRTNWLMSYVESNKRGSFTANKEIISLLGGMVFSYVMGAVIDYFDASGNTRVGFLICGATLFCLCILHLVSLLSVKEDALQCTGAALQRTHSLKSVFKATLFNRDFSKVIFLDILWHMSTGIAVSYYGTYQINELGFSLTYVAVLSAVYSLVRIAFSRFFGKYADRHSWSEMLILSFLIGAASFLINVFTVPANGKVMYTVYYIFYAIYYAGVNSGIVNITFDYAKPENRTYALGVKSAVGGICGFLASLAGGEIVSAVQANNNIVLGQTIYAQQILSLIAFLILVFAALYTKTSICTLAKVKN